MTGRSDVLPMMMLTIGFILFRDNDISVFRDFDTSMFRGLEE